MVDLRNRRYLPPCSPGGSQLGGTYLDLTSIPPSSTSCRESEGEGGQATAGNCTGPRARTSSRRRCRGATSPPRVLASSRPRLSMSLHRVNVCRHDAVHQDALWPQDGDSQSVVVRAFPIMANIKLELPNRDWLAGVGARTRRPGRVSAAVAVGFHAAPPDPPFAPP